MTTRKSRTPDWKVERIALGELPAAELLSEPDGAERLARIEASNAQILAALPPDKLAEEVQRRRRRSLSTQSARPLRWIPVAVGIPVLAAMAVLMVTRPTTPAQEGPRIKGLSPALELYRKRGAQSEALLSGARARAGDVLQLRYQRAGRTFGLIVSVDGTGAVTQHLPHEGNRPAFLEGSGAVALDEAYELDDAPGFERFFFVTGPSGFDAAQVVEAARALARDHHRVRNENLELPSGLEQASFLVEKDGR